MKTINIQCFCLTISFVSLNAVILPYQFQSAEVPIDVAPQIFKIAVLAHSSLLSVRKIDGIEETLFPGIMRRSAYTKDSVLQRLLEELLETWASMNANFIKGLEILSSLRRKAAEIYDELVRMKKEHLVDTEDFQKRLDKRIQELMRVSYHSLCVRGEIRNPLREMNYNVVTERLRDEPIRNLLMSTINNMEMDLDGLQHSNATDMTTLDEMKIILWGIEVVQLLIRDIGLELEKLSSLMEKKISSTQVSSDNLLKKTVHQINDVLAMSSDTGLSQGTSINCHRSPIGPSHKSAQKEV